MKQLKTAEEVLKESGVYPEDFISYSTMGGCQEAMRAYAEQFIEQAAEEILVDDSDDTNKNIILKLKEHLK